MNTLVPYRCKMEEKKTYDVILKEKQEEQKVIISQKMQKKQEVEQKKGAFAKIWDFWCRLGKRNQNRIINTVVGFVMAFFGAKSTTGSSTRSLRDAVQKTVHKMSKKK